MKLGLFGQSFHPPTRSPYDCQEWDLQVIRWLDEFGYAEAWFGEHHTIPWEPNPAPDILIGQALRETKNIRLGTGGVCLPYHNPAVVANRIAWLDHLSKGRLNFGVAAGAVPADWKLLGIDGAATRDMTRESLEIIQKIWTGERPFVYKGKYWTIEVEAPVPHVFDAHILPFQKPGPPIGVSGLSANSPTLGIAGLMGFLPMSLNGETAALRSHWDTYEAGARKAGRVANRADWRVSKEVFVAETDAKAEKLAVNGALGTYITEHLAHSMRRFAHLQGLPPPDSDLMDPRYLARNRWIVGSPETVREKAGEISRGHGRLRNAVGVCV